MCTVCTVCICDGKFTFSTQLLKDSHIMTDLFLDDLNVLDLIVHVTIILTIQFNPCIILQFLIPLPSNCQKLAKVSF